MRDEEIAGGEARRGGRDPDGSGWAQSIPVRWFHRKLSDERTSDLVAKAVTGAGTYGVSALGPPGALLGVVLSPFVERWAQGAIPAMGRTYQLAEERSRLKAEEFLDALTRTPGRRALCAEALQEVARTAMQEKQDQLAWSLVIGAKGDDDEVETERLWVARIASIELLHVRMLNCLASGAQPDSQTAVEFVDEQELYRATGLDQVAGRLVLDDLLGARLAQTVLDSGFGLGKADIGEEKVAITPTGRAVLERLFNIGSRMRWRHHES